MSDKMTRLEKTALASATIGAVFNVFLYAIGATLQDAGPNSGTLYILRAAAGVLQAASFDGGASATVLGMRAGRRSTWSQVTAWAAAAVSALIALDVAGVWPQPWLHAANSIIVLAFTLHLQAPRRTPRVAQLRRLVRRLVAAVRTTEQVLADREQDVASLGQQLAAERQRYEQELAALRRQMSSRPAAQEIEVIYVARHRLTWQGFEQVVRQLVQADTISLSSIRRHVARLADSVASATDNDS